VSMGTIAKTVVIFLGIPLVAGYLSRTLGERRRGREWYETRILAGHDLQRATAASLRRKLFCVPGRLVHSTRRLHLRLPARWPHAQAISHALQIRAIPLRC
jgi:Sodium Bile acid symporter family